MPATSAGMTRRGDSISSERALEHFSITWTLLSSGGCLSALVTGTCSNIRERNVPALGCVFFTRQPDPWRQANRRGYCRPSRRRRSFFESALRPATRAGGSG